MEQCYNSHGLKESCLEVRVRAGRGVCPAVGAAGDLARLLHPVPCPVQR